MFEESRGILARFDGSAAKLANRNAADDNAFENNFVSPQMLIHYEPLLGRLDRLQVAGKRHSQSRQAVNIVTVASQDPIGKNQIFRTGDDAVPGSSELSRMPMESSPLTQQSRPDVFEPKIAQLYLRLFSSDEDEVLPEGFWRELFLLRADKTRLVQILEPLTGQEVLQLQIQTQTLFRRAVKEIQRGVSPGDENALETLTAFLSAVLNKRYTNPSSDAIEVLAGLDDVDKLFNDLASGLDSIIRTSDRSELRSKALGTALSLTACAYQTGLVSYLIYRDLFPAIIQSMQEDEDHSFEPFLLLGLLANYNKFEFQNPYQNRLEDFVNEAAMHEIAEEIGHAASQVRDSYVAVQEDMPEGWNLSSTLTFVGLRALSPDRRSKKVVPTEEEAKELFNALPAPEAAVSLPAYSFINANKLFASCLVGMPFNTKLEAPLPASLSLTSYLTHHAYRSTRTAHYAMLNMLSIRVMVEDQILVKRLSSAELKAAVRLCRQRPPHLPFITSQRVFATVILDICTDTIGHNLKRRLDVHLYSLALGVMLRLVTHLGESKTRLQHHWAFIWGSLLSFIKFLNQYSSDLAHQARLRDEVCIPLCDMIAYCLSAGDGFLPDPGSYDDLFYKLIETGEALTAFKKAYFGDVTGGQDRSINVLISVSTHYHDLLQAQHGKKVHQSPVAVQGVIKQGYETLDIESNDELGQWERWREVSWKAEMKKIVRTVVDDARRIAERP